MGVPAGASAAAASASPAFERALTLAFGVVLTVAAKLVAGDAISLYAVGALLLLSAAVALAGVQKLLDLLSSVRFGVSLLVLLVVLSMIGMLIVQVNVDGFAEYYASLTPAQKLLYGSLGFFDIYHSRYFNFLLLVLSLNIVLASIDRFPKAWTYLSRPKLDASPHWLRGQEQHATLRLEGGRGEVAARVAAALRSAGMTARVTEKKGKTYVFGERGAWNRLGAYAVHVALLTIFAGGFLTAQFGRTGNMRVAPGVTSSQMTETVFRLDEATGDFAPAQAVSALPFEVECTDIQQKLIKKEGPLDAANTLDWLTRIKIRDETGEREALVHMNNPFDYRGYRFFQASFDPLGQARTIRLRATPEGAAAQPQELAVNRDGEARLADGTRVLFKAFFPDFVLGPQGPDTASDEYKKPAALLDVTPAGGGAQPERVYALSSELLKNAPMAGKAVGGYKFQLIDFEKAPVAHVLSVQRDPGANVVYVGFVLLGLTLCLVFFFSHQRVWAHVEERAGGTSEVTLGGNTNRNHLGFEDRFKRLVKVIDGKADGEPSSQPSA